jgi:hypothetical protein
MKLYTAGGQRWTSTCHYSLPVIPVLSPQESPLALESILRCLLDSLLGSLRHILLESLLDRATLRVE